MDGLGGGNIDLNFPSNSLINYIPGAWTFTASGLYMSLYINISSKEVVLAIRGTELTDAGDIYTDIIQALGIVPLQYLLAGIVTSEILPGIPSGYSFILTGHSLGGGIAQFVANSFGLTAITFNTAPLSITTKTLSKYNNAICSLFGYSDSSSIYNIVLNRGDDYFFNYDVVANSPGILLGTSLYIPVGNIGLTDLHSINSVVSVMEYRLSIIPVIPIIPTGSTFTNTLGMSFNLIPAGTFTMGSPSNEAGRYSDERQHKVTLSKSYYMQTTEVTQGQWKAVMGSNPSYFSSCGDNCPVEQVSWEDAHKFITKLNATGQGTYSLPTEAQWEYAARAGTSTPFNTGSCLSTAQANYDGDYPLTGCTKGEYRGKTVAAAGFAPNAFGLYDMHGNVWEWCQDWYGGYSSGSVIDPDGPGIGSDRVSRGGSWGSNANNCRSANRNDSYPSGGYDYLGFRLVCSAGQQ